MNKDTLNDWLDAEKGHQLLKSRQLQMRTIASAPSNFPIVLLRSRLLPHKHAIHVGCRTSVPISNGDFIILKSSPLKIPVADQERISNYLSSLWAPRLSPIVDGPAYDFLVNNRESLKIEITDLGQEQSTGVPDRDLFGEQFANFYTRTNRFTTDDQWWDAEAFGSAVKAVANMFPLRDLEPCSWNAARAYLLSEGKGQKAAGWPYCTSKQVAFEEHEAAIMQRAKALVSGKVSPDLAIAGFRTKGGKMRLIQIVGIHDTLVTARLYQPIQSCIKAIDSPWVTGIDGIALRGRVSSLVNGSDSVIALDWSKFDSTVPRKVIEAVFEIMRTWFRSNPMTNKLLAAAKRCFISCNLIMPDYRVYFGRQRGIPSGSLLTSLVGSLSNLILIEYLKRMVQSDFVANDKLLSVKPEITGCMVYGDDSVIGLNVDVATAKEVLSTWSQLAEDLLGMKLSIDKSFVSDRETHFLGHWYSSSRKWRPMGETLRQLVYPERFASWQDILTDQGDRAFSSWREFEIYRILGLYVDNDDPKTRWILHAYLSYLESRVVSEVDLVNETLKEVSMYDSDRFDWLRFLRPGSKSFVQRVLNN